MSKQTQFYFTASPRHKAALEILDTITCIGLVDEHGGDLERATDKAGRNHWSLLFCRTGDLDGVVRIYSERFIQVTWQQGGRDRKAVFRSPEDAKSFFVQTFYGG